MGTKNADIKYVRRTLPPWLISQDSAKMGSYFGICKRNHASCQRNLYFKIRKHPFYTNQGAKNVIYLHRKIRIMLDLARNILSSIGTFITITSISILVIQSLICLVRGYKFDLSKQIDYKIIITGIIIASILIPFYYLPA